MSGFVQEFSGASGAVATLSVTVAVPSTIPAGDSLVAAATLLDAGTAIASITASDSKGNSWICVHSAALTGSTDTTGHLLHAQITNALTTSDTITFTYPQYANRSAITIAQFNEVLTPDQYATGDNGGASTLTLTTPATATTTQANELIFGAWYMLNQGRIFTATNGFTGLTKVVSNGSTGNRAVVGEYKYVTAAGAYTANGTFDIAGVAIGMVQTFATSTAPVRTGKPKVWNGASWTVHPAKTWNGSAWVEHPASGYNGSSWVKSK